MVEPISLIVAAINIYGLISFGKDLFNKFFGSKSTPSTFFTTIPQIHSTTIYTSLPIQQLSEIKDKKSTLHSKKNDKSSSETIFPMNVILIILIIIGIMIFIVYRKQNKLKENRIKYRYSDKQIDSPENRSPTETNFIV